MKNGDESDEAQEVKGQDRTYYVEIRGICLYPSRKQALTLCMYLKLLITSKQTKFMTNINQDEKS